MAVVIVIPINKVDWHFNLEFSSDFTQGIPSHGWLSFWFSVLGVARYVQFLGCPQPVWYNIGQVAGIGISKIPFQTSQMVSLRAGR